MKKIFLLITLISLNIAFAEDKANTANHEAHHPKEEPKAVVTGDGMMDASQMSTMMGQCMEKNKDNKMCNQEMMKKCQEKKSKNDCSKMMEGMQGHDMNKMNK